MMRNRSETQNRAHAIESNTPCTPQQCDNPYSQIFHVTPKHKNHFLRDYSASELRRLISSIAPVLFIKA